MQTRRALLRAIGAGTVAVAGCSSGGGETTTTPATTTTTTSTSTTETTQPTSETTGRQCEADWSPDPAWTFEQPVLRAPVATDDRVLVPAEGVIFSLAPADGAVQWKEPVDGTIQTVTDGAVVVTDPDTITALELADGATRWTVDAPTEHATWSRTLQVQDGTAYVGAAQRQTPETDVDEEFGRIYAIDVGSGEQTQLADLETADGAVVEPEYVLADATGIYATLDRGGVYGLAADGTVRWRRYGEAWSYEPLRTGGLLVQPWSAGVVALDVASGETVWRDGRIEMHATVSDGVLYGAGGGSPESNGTVAALDAATGEAQWTATLDGCGGEPTVGGGAIALPVSCREARVELLDAASGCHYGALEATTSASTGAAIHDGTLYANLQGDGDTLVAVPLP